MAYHAASERVVLYDGSGASSETWTWDGADWTRLDTPVSPPPRLAPAMAQDPGGDGLVLFGGSRFFEAMGDTWSWDGQQWTLRAADTGPPRRYDAAMALHPPSQTAVLFGGNELSLSTALICCGLPGEADKQRDDTWGWDGGASPASEAASVQLALQPPSIPADPARGDDEIEVTVTVSAEGQGVAGQQIELSSPVDQVAFSEVTDHGDGTYTATADLSAAAAPQRTRVTADTTVGRDSRALVLEGPATRVEVGVEPDVVPADGASQAEVTAIVSDANQHRVTHEDVTVATDGPATVSAVANHGDGTYTATVTASETVGTETVTVAATKAGIEGHAELTFEPPAGDITLALDPDRVRPDGESTSQATVTVVDADGKPAIGEDIELATDGQATFSEVANHGDGTYTATVTAPDTVPGEEHITATASKAGISATATLTLGTRPGMWQKTGDLTHGRHRHAAVQLTGEHCGDNCGNVLVAGGIGQDLTERDTVPELYDPDVGEWRLTSDPLAPLPVRAVQLPDVDCGDNCGKVLFPGRDSFLYDPATET
jgi:hypothetical protein